MKEEILSYIEEKFKNDFDVKYRKIKVSQGIITMVFIDNLCDSKFISDYIVKPLVEYKGILTASIMEEEILFSNVVSKVKDKDDAISHILSGDVVITSNFSDENIYCEAKGFVKRSIAIPPTEEVIKGPREGFSEVIVDNIALIRRKIKNDKLKFENLTLGEKSNTVVALVYLKDTAKDELIDSIRNKVEKIKVPLVLDTNYIQESFESKRTVFDLCGYTEKPDVLVSKLLEGKIGILVDGSPNVLTVPYFFQENFQAADDYYLNRYYINILRLLRLAAFFIANFLPGFYIAMISYHATLIPTNFVFRIAIARAGVPFPAFLEVLLMIFFFQLLREASIRIPKVIGSALSIVGALILGDAAVGAGLASQSTVVVVAVSSIAVSLVPKLYNSSLVWVLIILSFSSLCGIPGFFLGGIFLLTNLSSLESCGIPYLYPFGTIGHEKSKDIFSRGKLKNLSHPIFFRGKKS